MNRVIIIDVFLIVVCAGAAVFVGTDLGGWWFPAIMGVIIVWCFLSLIIKIVDRSPVVIRLGNYQWTLREACRHFLLIGGTGSGKTEGGMVNILIQLIRNVPGLGGIALDAKGDFRTVIVPIFQSHGREDDIVILETRPAHAEGDWIPRYRLNLFDNPHLGPDKFVDWIADALGSYDKLSDNSFFDTRARLAIKNAMHLCRLGRQPITFSALRDFILDRKRLVRLLGLLDADTSVQSLAVRQWFRNVLLTENKETLGNILSTVDGYLSHFAHPEIEEVFWSTEPNVSLSDVEKGKVFLINVTRKFDTERALINTIAKNIFYDIGLARFEHKHKARNLLVGIFDEYQNHLSATKNGTDDALTIDKLRAADVIILAATQLKSSVVNRLKGEQHKAAVVLGNLTNWIIFKAEDDETAEMCAKKIGKKEIQKKSRTVSPEGRVSNTYNKNDEYIAKPEVLRKLRVCQCWVVHTNTNEYPPKQMTLPPRKANGEVADWWKNPANR
jgi:type IV secretory pathway TraG/TraD family ATPase VirD4